MSTYPITGIKTGFGPAVGQVPLRREIDEWWSSKDKNDLNQRSLFIYALHNFMNIDPDEQLSYFGVAGIHGQPLIPWDTVTPKKGDYCVHGTPLFPPWHRPYLLLYEQRLYEIMLDLIPTTFAQEDQAEMIQAAQTWRLPFWDWAMKKPDWHQPTNLKRYGPNVPYLITIPKVQVKTKTGFAEVDNPMWRFTLPTNDNKTVFGDYGITDDGNGHPYDLAAATSRHPSTFDTGSADFTSAWVNGDNPNWDIITGELRGSDAIDSNTLPEAVYRLFLEEYLPTYNAFATDGFSPGQGATSYSSLEDIHGQLHVWTGGAGQMGSVPVAAFDPIFWLHHCNVDRLLAIYQDLYPSKYVTPFRLGQGGPRIDGNSGLLPFHSDEQSSLWTSNGCRYQQKQCGYTYPELQNWLDKYKTNGQVDQAKYQKDLRAIIDSKYSTTAKATLQLAGNDDVASSVISKLTPQNLIVQNIPPTLLAKASPAVTEHLELKRELPTATAASASEPSHVPHGILSHVKNILPVHSKPEGKETPATITSASVPAAKDVPATIKPSAAPQPTAALTSSDEKWEENDYIVNVLYDRFALNGNPFLIRIFLGDVPQGPPFYFSDTPTQIGLVYNFSGTSNARGTGVEGCANCVRQREDQELSTGQVILTDYLVEHIRKGQVSRGVTLDTLDREDVVAYLKTNLHWRISDSNDVLIPKENMSSLKISVAMGKATHFAEASRFSKYENYEVLYAVSDGRLAGASPGDLD